MSLIKKRHAWISSTSRQNKGWLLKFDYTNVHISGLNVTHHITRRHVTTLYYIILDRWFKDGSRTEGQFEDSLDLAIWPSSIESVASWIFIFKLVLKLLMAHLPSVISFCTLAAARCSMDRAPLSKPKHLIRSNILSREGATWQQLNG